MLNREFTMTNKEIINEINTNIQSFTKLYFININSGMNYSPKDGDTYEIPGVGVGVVEINYLDYNMENSIKVSDITDISFRRKAINPLVRVRVSLDTVLEEWVANPSYMKSSIMGIINSVQRVWEKQFGSYKNQRFGNTFFSIKDLVYTDNSEYIFIDFYGDWASSKEE